MSKHRFEALDGLRGVAALMVLGYHAALCMGHQYIPHGHIAVDFFFGLSGFVVALAYEDRLKAHWDLMGFLVSRRDRLFPMLVLGSVIGTAVYLGIGQLPRSEVLTAGALDLFALPSLTFAAQQHGLMWIVNSPVWSLFWELIANACFVFVGFRLRNRALIAVISTAFCALLFILFKLHTLQAGAEWNWGWAGAARVGFSFTTGHLVYRFWRQGWRPSFGVNTPVLGAMLAIPMALPHFVVFPIVELVLATIWFPVIVWLGTQSPSRWAGWDYLGRLSYPLYLVHYPILEATKAIAIRAGLPLSPLLAIAGGAASVLIAIAALHLYDEPVRAWLARRRRARRLSTPMAKAAG